MLLLLLNPATNHGLVVEEDTNALMIACIMTFRRSVNTYLNPVGLSVDFSPLRLPLKVETSSPKTLIMLRFSRALHVATLKVSRSMGDCALVLLRIGSVSARRGTRAWSLSPKRRGRRYLLDSGQAVAAYQRISHEFGRDNSVTKAPIGGDL